MELKWENAVYQGCLIVRLGWVHSAMKFMQIICKLVESSGLLEAWADGCLLAPKTAEQVMARKSYTKGMSAHKITLQALWKIFLPQLISCMEEKNPDLKDLFDNSKNGPIKEFTSLLQKSSKLSRKPSLLAMKNQTSCSGEGTWSWYTYSCCLSCLEGWNVGFSSQCFSANATVFYSLHPCELYSMGNHLLGQDIPVSWRV